MGGKLSRKSTQQVMGSEAAKPIYYASLSVPRSPDEPELTQVNKSDQFFVGGNMNHLGLNVSRKFHRARAICLLVALGGAVAVSGDAAQRAVPAEFQGRWVPSKAACESPVAVVIGADRLTLVNGKDSHALGEIEMAGPGYWGPDYRGIMAVLITEFSGHQPVTASFNVGEKKGVAQLDFAPVMPGKAPAQKAYNAHISKLNLAKRFPLDKVPLKKCAGAASAR